MKDVIVRELPKCDMFMCPRDAIYDMPMLNRYGGKWAYLCSVHAKEMTIMSHMSVKDIQDVQNTIVLGSHFVKAYRSHSDEL